MRSPVQAFTHCRLDYCNALLAGITDTCLVSGARRRNHITLVLRSVHWLPVRRRIIFKTVHGSCFHGLAHLQELCVPAEKVQGRPRLWSASTGCVDLPRLQTSVGLRSFAFHGSTVWNSLPSPLPPAACHRTRYSSSRRLICLNSHERHPAPLWRFSAILAPDINVIRPTYLLLTYLLTYLLGD